MYTCMYTRICTHTSLSWLCVCLTVTVIHLVRLVHPRRPDTEIKISLDVCVVEGKDLSLNTIMG